VKDGVGEIAVLAWEPLLDGAAEQSLFTRRRHLRVIGQAGSIAVVRVAHAERVRLLCHQVGEFAFAAANRFGDDDGHVIGRFSHHRSNGILDCNGLPRPQPPLGRSLHRRMLRHRELGIDFELARLHALEQEV
jgi:hypothetical protein